MDEHILQQLWLKKIITDIDTNINFISQGLIS